MADKSPATQSTQPAHKERAQTPEPAATVPAPTATALVVPVPAAEPVVGHHRRVLDHTAVWGVPAHVTVLYPFVPPEQLTENTVEIVRGLVGGIEAFDCVFARISWFDQDAVWLAPEPAEPFRELTDAVWRRFPDHPPYLGRFADVVPHLTFGSAARADLAALRHAEEQVRERLPVRARIDRVLLLAGADAPDAWHPVAEFPLATP
ncbi:2'-5' RNA ligase family protein [Actinophytocola sediminis]